VTTQRMACTMPSAMSSANTFTPRPRRAAPDRIEVAVLA
jgi:hypothetical protein